MAFGDNQIDGYEEGNEPLTFHHKNGEYRKNEPQFAQDLANGVNQPKRGFFKVLVSTKGNRSMFTVMCLAFVIIILVNIFAKNPNESVVNGINCNITSFSFEDKVYVTLELKTNEKGRSSRSVRKSEEKTPVVKLASPKKVIAKFFLYNTDKAQSAVRESDCVFDGTTSYIRETFADYDIVEVKCSVTSADETEFLTSKVQQR